MFGDTETVAEFGSMDEIVADYINTHGEVAPEVEGRITVIE